MVCRDLQYTSTESHAVRLVGGDIQVFDPSDWSKGVTDKLKVEGITSITLSPGKSPSIAVFVGERKVLIPVRLFELKLTIRRLRAPLPALGSTPWPLFQAPQPVRRHSTRLILLPSSGTPWEPRC